MLFMENNMNEVNTVIKGRTFAQWKDEVERHVVATTGMDTDCLPDWHYARAWQAGMSPKIAAQKAIRAAKDF